MVMLSADKTNQIAANCRAVATAAALRVGAADIR
jgi:hypothetical protein